MRFQLEWKYGGGTVTMEFDNAFLLIQTLVNLLLNRDVSKIMIFRLGE